MNMASWQVYWKNPEAPAWSVLYRAWPNGRDLHRRQVECAGPEVKATETAGKALTEAKHGGMFSVVVGLCNRHLQPVFVNDKASFTTELSQMHASRYGAVVG